MFGTPPEKDRFARMFARANTPDDGTKEGGLVFVIAVFAGSIAAAMVHPLALTSFFVWFGLIGMSISLAVGVQQLVARFNGSIPQADEAAEHTQ